MNLLPLADLFSTEFAYSACFSRYEEEEDAIRFTDPLLPDMYMHNFLLWKGNGGMQRLESFIERRLEQMGEEKKEFLSIMVNERLDADRMEALFPGAPVTLYRLMTCPSKHYRNLREKEGCHICRVVVPEELEKTMEIDLLTYASQWGEGFTRRKGRRKSEAYLNCPGLSLYAAYKDNLPIGKCDLFIRGNFAKMEDFDILPGSRRQGYGTAMLRSMMEEACRQNAPVSCVLTEEEDTAKEMYTKCGFTTAGYRTFILFKLS